MRISTWTRRMGLAAAATLAGAAAVGGFGTASAATDSLQFLGKWKTKFKGGGPHAPGANVSDFATSTQLAFDPGLSSPSGGSPTATLTATRKVRLVDADGGGVTVTLHYDALLLTTDAYASLDVSLVRGKTPIIPLLVARNASIASDGFEWHWGHTVTLPAGDYTIVVKSVFQRSATGSYGAAQPPSTPAFVQFRLGP